MAQTIKLKRSATSGAQPSTSDLALGELGLNTYDGKVYMKKNDGSDAIVEVGAGASGTTYVKTTVIDSAISRFKGRLEAPIPPKAWRV